MGISAVASVGAASLGALSSIQSGQGQKAADNAQADELARRAEVAQLDATETNANAIQKMNVTLGNLDAIRAASHADPASPVTAALRSNTAALGNQQRVIQVGNILSQSEEDSDASNYLRKAGSYALDTSYLKAAGGMMGSMSKMTFPGSAQGGGNMLSDPQLMMLDQGARASGGP